MAVMKRSASYAAGVRATAADWGSHQDGESTGVGFMYINKSTNTINKTAKPCWRAGQTRSLLCCCPPRRRQKQKGRHGNHPISPPAPTLCTMKRRSPPVVETSSCTPTVVAHQMTSGAVTFRPRFQRCVETEQSANHTGVDEVACSMLLVAASSRRRLQPLAETPPLTYTRGRSASTARAPA
jgi:hypothetical protein